MSEVTIEPTPLVWMGDYDELPKRAEWQIGWAYFSHAHKYGAHGLSEHYKAHVMAIRQPIVVMCPAETTDGRRYSTPFCIDSHPSADPAGAWEVTVDLATLVVGQQPKITVTPSIHLVGTWHGWLQEGVLHQ